MVTRFQNNISKMTNSSNPEDVVVSSCKVCWSCRALLTEFCDSTIQKHIQLCSHREFSLIQHEKGIKHFVCDISLYKTFVKLKESLGIFLRNENNAQILKSHLPPTVFQSLLDLKKFSFLNGHSKQPTRSEKGLSQITHKSCQPSYYTIVNKACQTTINESCLHKSHLPKTAEDLAAKPNNGLIGNGEEQNEGKTEIVSQSVSEKVNLFCQEYTTCNLGISMEDKLTLLRCCDRQEVNSKVSYVCKLCSHATTSAKRMVKHQKHHNDGSSFECSPCNFSTVWRKEWEIHSQQRHGTGNDKFLCHLCAEEFQSKAALNQHIVARHADENSTSTRHPLRCESCNYVAREPASLKEHMRKHTGQTITCPHEGCQFQSPYARSLKKHLRQKHSVEKTHCCEMCGFKTRHSSSLAKHITLLHGEVKPYKCAKCSYTALYKSEIISHARNKHFKQKRFACNKCTFKTSYPLAIQQHVARHSKDAGFDCIVCGVTLSTRYRAKKHMQEDHGFVRLQVTKETNWSKINPNDYKIKEVPSLEDLSHVVIMNDPTKSIQSVEMDAFEDSVQAVTRGAVELDQVMILKSNTEQVYKLSQTMISGTGPSRNTPDITSVLDSSLYEESREPSKEGNPMLSATTADLHDNENSLSSLLDLMSDFPRPATLNRCQSATTLMFASLSPHLIDRPLTPDFFTESPSVASFFPSISSKNLESDTLTLTSDQPFETPQQNLCLTAPNTALSDTPQAFRTVTTPSLPILPDNFLCSPQAGSSRSLAQVNLSLDQVSSCMEVESVFSQLDSGCEGDAASSSAFTTLDSEIQAAVALIPLAEESSSDIGGGNCILQQKLPFSKT